MSDRDIRINAVSCVVPAYNEQERIADVLAAVVGHPMIGEVLVVDDGSTDATAEIVSRIAGVRLIRMAENVGKSAALAAGLRRASGPLILLLDADLIGLSPRHVTALIQPVVDGSADVSVSLRDNTMAVWRWIGLDYISGERVFPKSLLDGRLDEIADLPKFGFEVYMNELYIERDDRIAVVEWPGVASPFKVAKRGLADGVLGDMRMFADMLSAVPPTSLARQIPALRRRVVTAENADARTRG